MKRRGLLGTGPSRAFAWLADALISWRPSPPMPKGRRIVTSPPSRRPISHPASRYPFFRCCPARRWNGSRTGENGRRSDAEGGLYWVPAANLDDLRTVIVIVDRAESARHPIPQRPSSARSSATSSWRCWVMSDGWAEVAVGPLRGFILAAPSGGCDAARRARCRSLGHGARHRHGAPPPRTPVVPRSSEPSRSRTNAAIAAICRKFRCPRTSPSRRISRGARRGGPRPDRHAARGARSHRRGAARARAPQPPFLCSARIDPERLALPHRIVTEAWPETLLPPRAGVLTGPSFALEVARNLPPPWCSPPPTPHWAKHWVEQLHQPRLRLYPRRRGRRRGGRSAQERHRHRRQAWPTAWAAGSTPAPP